MLAASWTYWWRIWVELTMEITSMTLRLKFHLVLKVADFKPVLKLYLNACIAHWSLCCTGAGDKPDAGERHPLRLDHVQSQCR